jgi:calcineurin-like phosphoesterase family protein
MADYVISDPHFKHMGLLKYERNEFSSIKEHDQHFIKEFNKKVSKQDTCYILGDIGIPDFDYLKEMISQLNGRLIMIKGNHDTRGVNFYYKLGFQKVYTHPIYYNKHILFSHEPAKEAFENPYIINIHGHLHGSELTLSNFFNVSAKNIDYSPQNVRKYVNLASHLTEKRKDVFLNEWYAAFYRFWPTYKQDGIFYDKNTGEIDLEKSRRLFKNGRKN